MSITLPLDTLTSIALHVSSNDLDIFARVCKEWRAAVIHVLPVVMDRFKIVRTPHYCMVTEDNKLFITITFKNGKSVPLYGHEQFGYARKLLKC